MQNLQTISWQFVPIVTRTVQPIVQNKQTASDLQRDVSIITSVVVNPIGVGCVPVVFGSVARQAAATVQLRPQTSF